MTLFYLHIILTLPTIIKVSLRSNKFETKYRQGQRLGFKSLRQKQTGGSRRQISRVWYIFCVYTYASTTSSTSSSSDPLWNTHTVNLDPSIWWHSVKTLHMYSGEQIIRILLVGVKTRAVNTKNMSIKH